ncbi:MAG: O-antigen ligase family protein [Bacilli bacterium]|nr:O-antigen ligase family protein [bacterium]MDY2697429.1 O-antigen ligase family protein [Bacilli bacterium]
MNKVIKNNLSKIISIFILIQPVLDLITGICLHVFSLNLTIGIIIRMLFLLFIMYATTFIYKKKLSLIYYLIVAFYSIIYLINIGTNSHLFGQVQGLLRVFYFPLLLVSFYDLKDEIKISTATLFTTLTLYLIFIFIPMTLNLGFKSYEITKSGTLGYYNSANEISGIISILTPIVFMIFNSKGKSILKVIYILLYLVVILTIGTKTPLLSLLITIGMTFIYIMIKSYKDKKYKRILSSFIIIVIGIISLIILIPKTNFYKNIKVHLDFLKVEDVTDIMDNGNLIDHFIFSQRVTFLTDRKSIYDNATFQEKLFGIGYYYNGKKDKQVEMDYFDIYLNHGIIGFIIFFSVYLYILVQTTKIKRKLNFNLYMLNVSMLLILFLSLFTGHIITAPAVSLIVVVIIMMLQNRRKKELLFSINDLRVGGIETAIINLLNNIDHKKYNVTLVMEEKTGVLLKNVNKNVKVQELKVSNNKNVIIRKGINFIRKLNFSILNYHKFDFSCCYATYSLSANKIALTASKNNSIYVHSNYRYIYKDKTEFKNFFNCRNISSFRRIIFVANEAEKDFIKIYPELKNKCLVLNNFIDPDKILKLSTEKISETHPKNKKLFVFIGRLDDSSKKVSRAINLLKNLSDVNLLIVGDGPDRKMYEDLVTKNDLSKRVTFVGQKTNPYPYIKLADYIILTSDYEGFPVTYLEAITLHKRILTTIDVSDESINIGKDYATIISMDEKEMLKDVQKELSSPRKIKDIDIKKIQEERLEKLENIFNEVI